MRLLTVKNPLISKGNEWGIDLIRGSHPPRMNMNERGN